MRMMERWKRALLDLYAQLPNQEEVLELELQCLEEAAAEEALALLEDGELSDGPFQNPVVVLQGQHGGEVVRFLAAGEAT